MKSARANFYEVEESELRYHEKRASIKKFWGTLREKALSENILSAMPARAKKVLDIGCGDGYLCFSLKKKKNFFIVGTDIAIARLKNSKRNIGKAGFVGVRASAFALPFKGNSFDVVVCSQLLEHLGGWRSALKEAFRVSSSSLIITVPFEQVLIKEQCQKCGSLQFLSGHINSFSAVSLKKAVSGMRGASVSVLFGFHTIFSYNKATMRLPRFLRRWFDRSLIAIRPLFSFFKPSYLLARIEKKKPIIKK